MPLCLYETETFGHRNLETPEIARLNREAGFGDPGSKRPPMGRWKRVAQKWLQAREKNLPMLEGLVKAGYKETLKKLARKAGYKPECAGVLRGARLEAEAVFRRATARWAWRACSWSEARALRRRSPRRRSASGSSTERLSYKEVVGRLPKDVGLTPAIMVALLPSLSDRDLRMMTPTLEELGLLSEPTIRSALGEGRRGRRPTSGRCTS